MKYIQSGKYLSEKLQEFIRDNTTKNDRMRIVLNISDKMKGGDCISENTIIGMLNNRTKMPSIHTEEYNDAIVGLLKIAIPKNQASIKRRIELDKLYADKAA